MMFHRDAGELESELAEMDECMPHYYKITNGPRAGRGDRSCAAEAAFMQGRFADAQHPCWNAPTPSIDGNGQENMALCCDFLARRLSLCADTQPRVVLCAAARRRCCGSTTRMWLQHL